jgi:hypothetical protein
MLINALLLLTLVLANLPFCTERLFGVIALTHPIKPIGWCCVEIVVLYFGLGGLALILEAQQGLVHQQHWQFYVATACLFLVFAFPGIVIRYFWRKPGV